MEWCFFEKFETAGTHKDDVRRVARVDVRQSHTGWDVEARQRWEAGVNDPDRFGRRHDVHTVHRNSDTAYSRFAQDARAKIADAPRWPARDGFRTHNIVGKGGSWRKLKKQAWFANAKAQPVCTPTSDRQAQGIHVSTWLEPWQLPSSRDPHDSRSQRRVEYDSAYRRLTSRFTIQDNHLASTSVVPGRPSTSLAVSGGLLAPGAEGQVGVAVLLASLGASAVAVASDGMKLQHLPAELRQHRDVVLAAVWPGKFESLRWQHMEFCAHSSTFLSTVLLRTHQRTLTLSTTVP